MEWNNIGNLSSCDLSNYLFQNIEKRFICFKDYEFDEN